MTDPLGLFPPLGQSGTINAPGNSKHFHHDGLGRVVREVYDLRIGGAGQEPIDTSNPFNPDGQIALAYLWDGNSRLAGIVDDNGKRTAFDYDALDRKTVTEFNVYGVPWSFLFYPNALEEVAVAAEVRKTDAVVEPVYKTTVAPAAAVAEQPPERCLHRSER